MKTALISTLCAIIIGTTIPHAEANTDRRSKMKAQLQKKFDKDGDGKLNESERKELQKYRQARGNK